MKKIKIPTPYTVLMFVILLAGLLTMVLPSGQYHTLLYSADSHKFILNTPTQTTELPVTENTLQELGIGISIDKFTSGKIKKPISVPHTYEQAASNPQGVVEMLLSPIRGIYQAIDVVLFVLILGGFIAVFNSGGTLNQGVGYLSHLFKGKEGILIIVITTLVALGGTSFGLAEETFAFYPILVPVFLAAGYDLMVPLAVIYLGSSVGTMMSVVNPFSVIIASDAAGVDWTSGITLRIITLIVMLVVTISYIIRYGEMVKKYPERSIAYGVALPPIASQKTEEVTQLSVSAKLLLSVFGASFLVMIYGVSQLGWWFEEMTGLFFVSAVLIGLLQRKGEEHFIKHFVAGAKDLLGVAFIIGIARGVTIVLSDGQISSTILYECTKLVSRLSPFVFLPLLAVVYALLTLFISSSSGMATVTMPIMGALAVVAQVEGQSVVNAYMIGMGIMSFIAPTGLILPSLSMVNLNYTHWLKFVMPLLYMLIGLGVVFLWVDYLLTTQ